MSDRLGRFRTAQDDTVSGFATALAELQAGRKRSHWIWYVFPQLAGLGMSPMAVTYGLRDVDEATAYLRDSLLRGRLVAATRVVAAHLYRANTPGPRDNHADPVSLSQLMGSDIDARKLVSSMTLFSEIARRALRQPVAETTEERRRLAGDCEQLVQDADTILRAADAEGLPACEFTLRQLSASTEP